MPMDMYSATSKTVALTSSILGGVPKLTKERTLVRRLVTGMLKSDPAIDTVSNSLEVIDARSGIAKLGETFF